MTDTLALLIENSDSPNCIYIFNNSLRDYVVLDGANSDETVKSVTGFFCNKIWNRDHGINIVRKLKKDPPPSATSINGTVPWKDVSRYIVNLYITVAEHRYKKHKDVENKNKLLNPSVPENVLPFVCDEDTSNNCIKNFINEKMKLEKQKKLEEFEEITDQLSLEESDKNHIKPILKNLPPTKQTKKVVVKSPVKSKHDDSSLSDSDSEEVTKNNNVKNKKNNDDSEDESEEESKEESKECNDDSNDESEEKSEEESDEESEEEPKKPNIKSKLNKSKQEPIKKNQPVSKNIPKIGVNKTKPTIPIVKKKVK